MIPNLPTEPTSLNPTTTPETHGTDDDEINSDNKREENNDDNSNAEVPAVDKNDKSDHFDDYEEVVTTAKTNVINYNGDYESVDEYRLRNKNASISEPGEHQPKIPDICQGICTIAMFNPLNKCFTAVHAAAAAIVSQVKSCYCCLHAVPIHSVQLFCIDNNCIF